MPRLRPRFTLRWLMIGVAVVAVAITTVSEANRLIGRSLYFRDWAKMHGLSESREAAQLARTEAEIIRCKDPEAVRARCRRAGYTDEHLSMFVRDEATPIRQRDYLRKMVAYHATMRQRFEAASWRPWTIVRIDPMPEWED